MPDYGRYCPIALATEVVADRWTPLILRELFLGNTRFNDLVRGLPGISRSLLSQRLDHLDRRGVVERWPSPTGRGHEYRLTPAGSDLEPIVDALGKWAVEWLYDDLDPHDIDPATLLWWMHRRVDPRAFPPQRVVIEFRFLRPERRTIWMVLDRGEASVCMQHPGFDADVVVTCDTAAPLAEVFRGSTSWHQAAAAEAMRIDGLPALTRALPKWFLLSPFSEVTRARAKR